MRTVFSLSILALAMTLGAIAQQIKPAPPAPSMVDRQNEGNTPRWQACQGEQLPMAKLEDLVRWAIFGSTAPTYQVAMVAKKSSSYGEPLCTECLHGWQYCDLGGPVWSPVPCGRVIHKKEPW